MCKMMTSLDAFFIFSKFFLSWLLEGSGGDWGGGLNGKKWPKLAKKFVSHSVSQEPHFIELWGFFEL